MNMLTCGAFCVVRLQVPLDQILSSQRELLALQHIIQREHAATHARIQVMATGAPLDDAGMRTGTLHGIVPGRHLPLALV